MTQAIHQFVAGYSNGDAISNEARVWRNEFRSWGRESEIYCETKRILPELQKDARDLSTAATSIGPDDIVILHLSIGSDANLVFKNLNCRKAIIYHNITPADFFLGYQEEIYHSLRKGREHLKLLRDASTINLADSQFNADELKAEGYHNPSVLPLLLDRSNWKGNVDKRIVQEFDDGYVNILFVGRCAPNKRIEDLMHTLYFCQKYIQRDTRILHVGSVSGLERYEALLQTKARELKVGHFEICGSVTSDQLRGYYKAADVFLCLSEHEGFCIPLLEAMGHGVPVIAYDAGAVAETMDGAGVLIRDKQFDVIAETVMRVATDQALKQAIVQGQHERLKRYEQQDIPGMMKQAITPLLK